jgi:heat shock protein HtpX
MTVLQIRNLDKGFKMYKIWNNFKTGLLLSLLMGLCLAIGYLLGGQAALLPALIIGGILNFFAFFFSDKIALATMRARRISRPEDPVLWDTVQELTERAGLPMPRVYISPAPAPNAFATGRGPHHSAVCVTEGLRQMLSHDELEGVIAHELSHIKHRDILISTIAAVVAGAITWVTYLVFWGGGNRRTNPLVALVLLILAPLAAALIQMAISRSREFEADRAGAGLVGSGRGLAGALQKLEMANRRIPLRVPDGQSNMFIVAPLTGSDMAKLFRTHPPTEERIARLLNS